MSDPTRQNNTQERIQERRDEQLLFQRFQTVATRTLDRLSRRSNNDDLKFGTEEQRILREMTGMGLKEGILASVASFVVLRRGPKYVGRWMQQRQQRRYNHHHGTTTIQNNPSSSYELSDPTKLVYTSSNSNGNNPFTKAANPDALPPRSKRGFIGRSIWFVFDSVLSLMVGANVSAVYTDKEAIRQQIVDLPLVSGRSLVADSLCDELVRELRQVRNERDPTLARLQNQKESTPASYYMDGIIQFCQNCERRRYFERRIRDETGAKGTSVEIPVPGVPRDSPRLVITSDGRETVVDNDGEEEELFVDPFSANHDDAGWDTNGFGSDGSDTDGSM